MLYSYFYNLFSICSQPVPRYIAREATLATVVQLNGRAENMKHILSLFLSEGTPGWTWTSWIPWIQGRISECWIQLIISEKLWAMHGACWRRPVFSSVALYESVETAICLQDARLGKTGLNTLQLHGLEDWWKVSWTDAVETDWEHFGVIMSLNASNNKLQMIRGRSWKAQIFFFKRVMENLKSVPLAINHKQMISDLENL